MVLLRSSLITFLCPPLVTKFLLFFAAPSCPRLSALGSPTMVPHQHCSPPGLPPPFLMLLLLFLPLAHAPLPLSSQNAHFCTFVAACSACPHQPGLAACSRLLPAHLQGLAFSSGAESQEGRHLLPAGLPAPPCSRQEPAFQRKLCLGSSGGCYLVTITYLFLCDLDVASSHQLKSPNVRFLPVEGFRDAPGSPLAV